MTTDPNLEAAAREFLEKLGEDPDEEIWEQRGLGQGLKLAWQLAADEIRRHALLNEAVERAKGGVTLAEATEHLRKASLGWRPISEAPYGALLELCRPKTGERRFGEISDRGAGCMRVYFEHAGSIDLDMVKNQGWLFRIPTPLPEPE